MFAIWDYRDNWVSVTVSKHSEDGVAGLSPAMRPCKRSEENRTVNGVRELTAVSPIVF